jgi:hypothetical protein
MIAAPPMFAAPPGLTAPPGLVTVSESREQAALVEQVKAAQRSEAIVRAQWRDYCDLEGGGTRDPRLHTASFLRQFFRLREANALPECSQQPHELPMPEEGREDSEAREILAAKVKHGQRSCQIFRQAWWDFCDSKGLRLRDPMQHDCSSLRSFLALVPGNGHIVPDRDPFSAPPLFSNCPLTKCVKVMQSSKMKWKRQWDAYCDDFGSGIKDPSRHPPLFLEKFIMTAVPACPERLLRECLGTAGRGSAPVSMDMSAPLQMQSSQDHFQFGQPVQGLWGMSP